MIGFILVCILIVMLALALVTRPLWMSTDRGDDDGGNDIDVYKDQLSEIDRDVARGVLSAAEAEPSRIEIARRLLAADASRSAGAGRAPRGASLVLTGAIAAMLIGGSGLLYSMIGAPGVPDQPLAGRAEERPTQDMAEAAVAAIIAQDASEPLGNDAELIAQLRKVLDQNPDDVTGHRLLATSMARYGQYGQARVAQARVVKILGDTASSEDLSTLSEFMVFAAGGYVSPQAEKILARALRLDPKDRRARFYSGVSLAQNGKPALALNLWENLFADGGQDEAWKPFVLARAQDLSRQTGVPLPTIMAASLAEDAPGPTAEDIDAAADMTPEDRLAMIEGMVSQLSERLATEGGPPNDWARLIRSLGVLDRAEQAGAIYREALGIFADDPAALDVLKSAGQAAGVPQ